MPFICMGKLKKKKPVWTHFIAVVWNRIPQISQVFLSWSGAQERGLACRFGLHTGRVNSTDILLVGN